MQFMPYNSRYASGVIQMLANHFDFTPESVSEDNMAANIAYFKETYVDEGGHGICYILLSDEDGSIIGFLSTVKQDSAGKAVCWHITSLFVCQDEYADVNALSMVDGFLNCLRESNELCVNVHPAATKAIAFWTERGFMFNPQRSVFSNASDERLSAYWKAC